MGYALEDGDVRFDCVVVNASLFNDFLHDPIHARYVAPYMEGRLRFPVKPAESPSWRRLLSALDEVIEELVTRRPAYELITKSKLYTLFVLLARTFMPAPFTEKTAEPYFANRDRYKHSFNTSRATSARNCRLAAAAEVGLNPFHFCKMFKRLTGRTFVDYVNLTRMNEAERSLRERTLTITEIAGIVGRRTRIILPSCTNSTRA